MANQVLLSVDYIPNPSIGKALALADIYVGTVDLDPKVVGNQKQISVLQENGTTVQVSQPISTSAGGVPLYNGSPVTMYVDGDYSLRIDDSAGTQVYYVPKNSIVDLSGSVDTIADLRAISYTPSAGQVPNVLGYYAKGDGGGGPKRYWVAGAAPGTYVDNGGSIIVLTGGDGSEAFLWDYSGPVNVKWFGAYGDGTHDDTVAIQTAYDLSDVLFIPGGTYLVTSTININRAYTTIYGDGAPSIILFRPTANDVCINVEEGIGVIYQVVLRDLRFQSDETTFAKTAIRIVDSSSCIFQNLKTSFPHWGGSSDSSIFLHLLGRELNTFNNISCQAERPILLSPIPAPHPAANIGIDQTNFKDCYLVSSANNYPIIEMETGLLLTQTGFSGFQSWIGGTHGVQWIDTTSAGASNGLYLTNVRAEQSSTLVYYLVYINHNTTLQGVTVQGGQCGNKNGFYLRNVDNFSIKEFYFTTPTGEAMNIDASVVGVYGENCFWQAATTATLAGQRAIFETPNNPNTGALAPTFYFDSSSNGDLDLDTEARLNLKSGQLKFPVTQIPSTDVNVLDDYKEGTFTPTWTPAAGSGQTVTNAVGEFIKIGKRVFIEIFISTSGIGTASGTITIADFPYTAATSLAQGGLFATQVANANVLAGQNATIIMTTATTTGTINLFDSTGGTTPMQVSEWGASGNWRFSGSYVASE